MNVNIQLTDVEIGSVLTQLRISTADYLAWCSFNAERDVPEYAFRIIATRQALQLSDRMVDCVYDYDPKKDPSRQVWDPVSCT